MWVPISVQRIQSGEEAWATTAPAETLPPDVGGPTHLEPPPMRPEARIEALEAENRRLWATVTDLIRRPANLSKEPEMIKAVRWFTTLLPRFAHRCACDEIAWITSAMASLHVGSAGHRQYLARWAEVNRQVESLQDKLHAAGVSPWAYSLTGNEQLWILAALAATMVGVTIYFSWV